VRRAVPRVLAGSLSITVAALAGCGGDRAGTAGTDDARPAGGAAAPTVVSAARVSPKNLPAAPELRHPVGAIADVRRGACPTAPGRVRVQGTVRNPTSAAVDYAVTVNWVSASGDVRDRAVTTVARVRPGRAARWAATTTLQATNVAQCTLFVQRGTLADHPKGTQ
jgi:hypothetical protein